MAKIIQPPAKAKTGKTALKSIVATATASAVAAVTKKASKSAVVDMNAGTDLRLGRGKRIKASEQRDAANAKEHILAAIAASPHKDMMKLREHIKHIHEGDYVVIEVETGNAIEANDGGEAKKATTYQTVRVTEPGSVPIRGVAVKDSHYRPQEFTFLPGHVLASFGKTPPSIKVGGTDLLDGFSAARHEIAPFGFLHFDYEPSDTDLAMIQTGFSDVYAMYKAQGLIRLPELFGVFEASSRKAKYLGCVWPSRDLRSNPYKMRIRTKSKSFSELEKPADRRRLMRYLLAHEFAHVVDMQICVYDSRIKAAWTRVFNRIVRPTLIRDDHFHLIDSSLRNQSLSAKEAFGIIAEQAKIDQELGAAFKHWKEALKRTESFSLRDLLLLREADWDAFIEAMPAHAACTVAGTNRSGHNVNHKSGLVTAPTAYACTKPVELLAETIAIFLSDSDGSTSGLKGARDRLDPVLFELAEKTLKAASRMLPELLRQIATNSPKEPIVLL